MPIKITHSVNNGEYGGESMILWDAKLESLVSWYFTTAGFYTQANMIIEDDQLVSHEKVTGNENGITEVKSTMQFLSNSHLHTKSEYLKIANGFLVMKYFIKKPQIQRFSLNN